MRIEPDPCIPIVARSCGWEPDRVRHVALRGKLGFVGMQVEFWHDSYGVSGRLVYPRADLRPDGLRILKEF